MGLPALVLWSSLASSAAALCPAEPDNDRFAIPEPAEDEAAEALWSDGAYFMSVYQAEKALDLGWLLRRARLRPPREAGNLDDFDETPDSAWFTNRRGCPGAGATGAGEPPEPPWLVVSGKGSGISSGFTVRDAAGRLFFVKFDPRGLRGMATNAELIVSRILREAGYNAPENHQVLIAAADIRLSIAAEIPGKYKVPRPMTRADLDAVLENAARVPDGRLLALASAALPGKPKGPFRYLGTRPDDPNDTVPHEDRRELRGLRLVMAWVNNTDARRGNTLDTFVAEDGRGYLRHHLLDFSSSFGSGTIGVKERWEGDAYFFDPPQVAAAALSLGLRVQAWERECAEFYPELGRFCAEGFDPEAWKTSYANPAFERLSARDAFWAARLVTSFSDADISRLVASGHFYTPGARARLERTLRARRDAIGRFGFDPRRVNPLDGFRLERREGGWSLLFADLAAERGLAPRAGTVYELAGLGWSSEERFFLPQAPPAELVLRTSRDGGRSWSRPLAVLLERGPDGPRLAGLHR